MIYLDNAATSFPKPLCVTEEQARCMRQYCGNPGRGSHALALAAAEKIYECRIAVAELLGASQPENVVFTANATMALNTVIKGLLQNGDHVLLSDLEHNATWRPIFQLARQGRITYDVFPSLANERGACADDVCAAIEGMLRPNTKALVTTHASNICSAVLPIEKLGALCKKHKLFFIVDAAQSAGHIPINVEKMKVDALCAPGHKGLLGPQGSGFFWLREGVVLQPLLEGGSGYHSLRGEMPTESPERYEAGTLATPAIAGLLEGIREVRRLGIERIAAHEYALNAYLQQRLAELSRVTVLLPHRIGSILLFSVDGMSADEVGNALDQRGFCVRCGYHCAALAHATLQTPKGGAVRVSPGYATTLSDMRQFADAVEAICRS